MAEPRLCWWERDSCSCPDYEQQWKCRRHHRASRRTLTTGFQQDIMQDYASDSVWGTCCMSSQRRSLDVQGSGRVWSQIWHHEVEFRRYHVSQDFQWLSYWQQFLNCPFNANHLVSHLAGSSAKYHTALEQGCATVAADQPVLLPYLPGLCLLSKVLLLEETLPIPPYRIPQYSISRALHPTSSTCCNMKSFQQTPETCYSAHIADITILGGLQTGRRQTQPCACHVALPKEAKCALEPF